MTQRFTSLTQVPAETRRLLRDRLARYLPSQHGAAAHIAKAGTVALADELLLQLLLNLSIEFASDLGRARIIYESALPSGSTEPNWNEVIAAGWFRTIWGRISTPFDLAQAARTKPDGGMTAFVTLMGKRFEQSSRVSDAARSIADLVDIIDAINHGTLEPANIACQSPEWVAARLWDRPLTEATDHAAALRVWVDRWELLGSPTLVPGQAWNETDASAFRDAAIATLESEPGFLGWEEKRAEMIKKMALIQHQPPAAMESYVPPIPITLVDRALWLADHRVERTLFDPFDASGRLFGLARLLFAEIQEQDHAPAPHPIATRLFALAAERPELLFATLFTVRANPVLLADLLLYPETAAFACLLVAQWSSRSGAWDRDLSARDDQTTKDIAFADAVSVLGHHLEKGFVDPAEPAALFAWLHQRGRPGFVDDLASSEAMLATLRSELTAQSETLIQKMVAAFAESAPRDGLGTARFAAALDLIDGGELSVSIDPSPLLDAYVGSIAAGEYSLSANRVSMGAATCLYHLAERASAELRHAFLFPLDVKARLAAITEDENPYSLADTLARALRAHIRILSRATAGAADTAPPDLVDALVTAVRSGALKHEEKGRIAAFSARYEADPIRGPIDRPIAADLGAALTAVTDDHRERLLLAILEIDEPMVLAQLLAFSPRIVRSRIERRIADLTPSEAGAVYSLTEAQARIEALLSEGLVEAAAQFIEAERDLMTLGKAPGREITRLRATLRLQLLRRDWDGIVRTEPPPDLSVVDQTTASETIAFYKALAALLNPAGDRRAAEQMFAQLHRRRPDIVAYAANLFAAQISVLLDGDLFSQLGGAALLRGRTVLADTDHAMRRIRVSSEFDTDLFTCNKALLLLALGQPDRAHQLLTVLHTTRLRDSAAAYDAIALARMQRLTEAMATLDQAVQVLGETDVLKAARDHIRNGKGFAAIAHVLAEDDPVRRVKLALLELLQMNPPDQAAVLLPGSGTFEIFVSNHVRSAAASLVSLVPMMPGNPSEDDLSTFMRELLTARLSLIGWSVSDQSKGGFTAKENPGERDLVLRRDSATLAVIEAVVCDRPVTQQWARQELTSHFQKLFAYSTCSLFFHVTYSYIREPASILDHLRQTAAHDVPAGFTFQSCADIPFVDSQPVGFTARYVGQFGPVHVVFLVLDLFQHPQREAAKTAAASNPRTTKSPKPDAPSAR